MIEFSGRYEMSDLSRGHWLHFRPSALVMTGAAVAGLFVLVGVPLAILGSRVHPAWALAPWALVAIVAWSFIAAVRATVKKAWATSKRIQRPITGNATPDKIDISTDSGQSSTPWGDLYKVKASRDLVILYESAALYYLFPRHFFAGEETWTTFRRWALERVDTDPPDPTSGSTLKSLIIWIVIFTATILLWNHFRGGP